MPGVEDTRPRVDIRIANLYDEVLGHPGTPAGRPPRDILVVRAVIDSEVFSVVAPPKLVKFLGLTAESGRPGRLSPVRV